MNWKKNNPHSVKKEMDGDYNPHSVTVEALLTPRARETELIHLPRAEYERLIREEENLSRICNLLRDNSLSPYTIGEVVKAMFPEKTSSFGGSVSQSFNEANFGSSDSIETDLPKASRSDSAGDAETAESEASDA